MRKLRRSKIGFLVMAAVCLPFPGAQAQSGPVSEVAGITLSVTPAPALGDPLAPVALIEFCDFQCPLSSRHFTQTARLLFHEFIRAGKVRYYFKDYPIESIHPLALKAAEGAYCAGEQGKFWEMHGRLLRNLGAIAPEFLPLHAQMMRIDVAEFSRCLDSGRYTARIRESAAEAKLAGVRGTPGFFLALAAPAGSGVRPSFYIDGAQPYEVFAAAIRRMLASAPPATEP
jgi:protein-disulfide isomerase